MNMKPGDLVMPRTRGYVWYVLNADRSTSTLLTAVPLIGIVVAVRATLVVIVDGKVIDVERSDVVHTRRRSVKAAGRLV